MTETMLGMPPGTSGTAAGDPGAESPGHATLLRLLVKERHWQKYETFKAQLERAARSLAKQEEEPLLAGVTISLRTWERWLTGKLKSEPRPDACRVLEHMLGYPVRDLFAPAREDFTRHQREKANQAIKAPARNGLRRRKQIKQAPKSLPARSPPIRGRPGPEAVPRSGARPVMTSGMWKTWNAGNCSGC